MANTPNGVPYPDGNDVPDAPFWLQQLAEYIDTSYGDTGWITPTISTGWSEFSTGYQVRVRRIGKTVWLRGALARAASGDFGSLLLLPPGFTSVQQLFLGTQTMSSQASYNLLLSTAGVLSISTSYAQGTLPASGGAWPITSQWVIE